MKRIFKIIWITLLTLLSIFVIIIGVSMFILLSPKQLTKIVNTQVDSRLACKVHVDMIDLSLFGDNHNMRFQVKNLIISDTVSGAMVTSVALSDSLHTVEAIKSDTIVSIPEFYLSVNIRDYLRRDILRINELSVIKPYINIYNDFQGNSNLDGLYTKQIPEVQVQVDDNQLTLTTEDLPFKILDIRKMYIRDLNVQYVDMTDTTIVKINNSNTNIVSTFEGGKGKGKLDFNIKGIDAIYQNQQYANNLSLTVNVPFGLSINDEKLSIDDGFIQLGNIGTKLYGDLEVEDDSAYKMNISVEAEDWNINNILSLVPASYKESLSGLTVPRSQLSFLATLSGTFSDNEMPLLSADVKLSNTSINYSNYKLNDVNLDAAMFLNMNEGENSTADVKNISFRYKDSDLALSGKFNDILDKIDSEINVKGLLALNDLNSFSDMTGTTFISGKARFNVDSKFNIEQITNSKFEDIKYKGNIGFTDINASYADTIKVLCDKADLNVENSDLKDKFLNLGLNAKRLNLMMGSLMKSVADSANINISTSNFMDTTRVPLVDLSMNVASINTVMDTINLSFNDSDLHLAISPSEDDVLKPVINAKFNNGYISGNLGESLKFNNSNVKILADVIYDQTKISIMEQFQPNVNIRFTDGKILYDGIEQDIIIPNISMIITPHKVIIPKSTISVGKSEFSLDGYFNDIDKYMENQTLLSGDFNFTSPFTDVNELMAISNKLTASSQLSEETDVEDSTATVETNTLPRDTIKADPFMVPKGIDITLHTDVKNVVCGNGEFQNLGGDVTIKDGKVIMQQLGFTSDAARMQLTAIYKPKRKNHIYVGMNFHLLDIDIAKMIDMIPQIDTLMPMLKSFDGHAQFHMSAETYLRSDYSVKYPTLMASFAIEGADLKVMDSDTYRKISRLLMFSKNTSNKIDSLSAEISVFRNNIDVYPFLIKMDRYSAIISGRHTLDNAYKYHLDCALPARVGLDVTGKGDDLHFKLGKAVYKNLYNPKKRNYLEQRTFKFKKIISESLKETVRPQEKAE